MSRGRLPLRNASESNAMEAFCGQVVGIEILVSLMICVVFNWKSKKRVCKCSSCYTSTNCIG